MRPASMEGLLQTATDFSAFARGYFDYLHQLMRNLDAAAIEAVVRQFQEAREQGNTLFIIGNGGSAATASHMGNDFSVGANRVFTKPFKVMPLTDNVSVMTAIGNDSGYEELFLQQLKAHFRPGDKLLTISASGNSPNLVVAAEWFRAQGGTVMSFLGFDGGKLLGLSDIAVVVKTPKGEYGPVEDIHMVLDHLMQAWIVGRR